MLHIINHQLLGDSLMATPALKKLTDLGVEYAVYFLDEGIMNIYHECGWMKNKFWGVMPGDVAVCGDTNRGDRVIKLESGEALNFAMSTGKHYAFGFANQLGVEIDSPMPDINFSNWSTLHLRNETDLSKYTLIFPESSSCASRSGKKANKMLPWETWRKYFNSLPKDNDVVFIVPRLHDGLPADLPFIADLDIRVVAHMLKKAGKVLTVDNGIGHLSSAVGANCFMIGGCVPVPWIWAEDLRKTLDCRGNPELVTVDHITSLLNQ